MKVAGSSWSLWWLLLCNCAGLLFGPITLVESSNTGHCEPLNSQAQIEFDHEENLIEELATASKDTGKVPSLLDDILKNYDATPFWYNLIQAISLASGITPTTEALMHDLVTSSFSSDSLNGSIKKVLTAIKCNENKTNVDANPQTQKQNVDKRVGTTVVVGSEGSEVGKPVVGGSEGSEVGKPVVGGSEGSEGSAAVGVEGDGGSGGGSAAALVDHRPPEPPMFVDAQEWNPWDSFLSALWKREQEGSGNELIGPVPGLRLRRELHDRRRGGGAVADLHQPFFMSEVVPSSLVTRHPSIISVSGCPSGHIQDLRGVCRQIFQYTVNYGGGGSTLSAPSPALRPPGSGERRRWPWLFGGTRPAPQPVGGSLKDVARESSLFKHSVLRGYIPPFIFSNTAGARNLQTRLGLDSRPNPSLVSNSDAGAAQEDFRHSPVPSPVELMKTMPQVVLIGDAMPLPALPPNATPSIPSMVTLPSLPSPRVSQTETADENQRGRGDRNGGGGSWEHFETSNARSRDDDRREKEAKAAKKARDKLQSTTSSSNDDDD